MLHFKGNMDMFMPSEIARLVLGYLKEEGCPRTINIYLTENQHLSEYVVCLKLGREYPTTIAGKTLTDILQEYCELKASARKPQEMGHIIHTIERNLVQIKHIVSNTLPSETNASPNNVAAVEKTSVLPLLLNVENDNENSGNWNAEQTKSSTAGVLDKMPQDVSRVSVATDMDDLILPQQKLAMVDTCTQCAEETLTPIKNCVANAACSGYDDTMESASQTSSTGTQTPNRYGYRSWGSTPICRPVDFYSSPTSMVKSALIYNFGADTFQTPPKDRYLTDTPSKDRYLAEDGTWKSPRRKNQLPRKRLSYTPSSTSKTRNVATTSDDSEAQSNDNLDVTVLIDKLLHNTALHEKIADNINKVVNNPSQAEIRSDSPIKEIAAYETVQAQPSSREAPMDLVEAAVSQSTLDDHMPEAVIKDIVSKTESDPVFEAFLNIFFDKQDGNFQDSQVSGVCSEAPSPDTHGTPLSTSSTLPASVTCTPMSDSVLTPGSVAPSIEVDRGHPDSFLIANQPNGSSCPTSVASEVQTDNYVPIITVTASGSLHPDVDQNSRKCASDVASVSNTTALNGSLTSGQVTTVSLLQNGSQLHYTSAPTTTIPNTFTSYNCSISNALPALNPSKPTTIIFPFCPNTGTIIGPVMATLPMPAPTPLLVNLPKDAVNSAPPVQYFHLNLQGNKNIEFINQLPPISQTQIMNDNLGKSCTQAVSGKLETALVTSNVNALVMPKNVKDNLHEERRKGNPVENQPKFDDISNDGFDHSEIPELGLCMDRNANLSELMHESITFYGQDMQEHRLDNSTLQKLISSSVIGANKCITITPIKSTSNLQFVTLSPGPILPMATAGNSTCVLSTNNREKPPIIPQQGNKSKTSAAERLPVGRQSRPNILRKKRTKFISTGQNVIAPKEVHTIQCATRNTKSKPLALNRLNCGRKEVLDFGHKEPVSILKPQTVDAAARLVTVANSKNGASEKSSTNIQTTTKEDSDCCIISVTKKVPNSMPTMENLNIIRTAFSSRTITSNKSPQLTSLIQTASLLKASQNTTYVGDRRTSHVRTLDFSPPAKTVLLQRTSSSENKLKDSEVTANSDNKEKGLKGCQKKAGHHVSKKPCANTTSKTKTKQKCAQIPDRSKKSKSDVLPSNSGESNTAEESTTISSSQRSNNSLPVKKRTSSHANLPKLDKTPSKKSRGNPPGKGLSVMDVDKFLSGLKYTE